MNLILRFGSIRSIGGSADATGTRVFFADNR